MESHGEVKKEVMPAKYLLSFHNSSKRLVESRLLGEERVSVSVQPELQQTRVVRVPQRARHAVFEVARE
jgi:hypothetical protein